MNPALLLFILAPATSQGTVTFDARAAEHLLNRAGFGGTSAEIQSWVERGQEALVEHLLAERPLDPTWEFDIEMPDREDVRGLEGQARAELVTKLRRQSIEEARSYLSRWCEDMIRGDNPLHDRMRLFWHGVFTSGLATVKRGDMMIRQAELIARHALGDYGAMLEGMLTDPAMLIYLDNISNRKGQPNENLAREVFELFSLGEGNYSERDIQESARALTGNGVERGGEFGGTFSFNRREHDYGIKTILGSTGRFDSSHLPEIILEQRSCARWIAGSLLEYFEGQVPSEERLEQYAELLRRADYEVRPLLRALFLDPEFYDDSKIAARVQSPIDFLVSSARRMRIEPDGTFIHVAASGLGEALFNPPNVKGWDGGMAWITTDSLIQRGNAIGVMLGQVTLRDLGVDEELNEMLAEEAEQMDQAAMAEMDAEMDQEPLDLRERQRVAPELVKAMRAIFGRGRQRFVAPATNFRRFLAREHPTSDEQAVSLALEELLAIVPPPETHVTLTAFLKERREALGLSVEDFFGRGGTRAEEILQQLAHLILSLPEAQLG